MKSEALNGISLEINMMYCSDAKPEALNECIIPLLNVLKPYVHRIGNQLHI